MAIDPTTWEELPDVNEATQEALLLQGEEIKNNWDETNSLLQALIAQNEGDNDSLIEAQIIQDKQIGDEIVTTLKETKSNLNIDIDGVQLATLQGEQGEKWDKGDKGDPGSVELTMPDWTINQSEGKIVIKWLKWDKGDKWDQGEKWNDWRDGIDWKVILGMNGRNGIDGKDWIDGEKGDKWDKWDPGSPDTPKQIKKKLESLKDDERLDYKAIKGIETFQKQINRVAGFASQGQEYRISGTKVANNAWVLNFVAGSGATITGVPTADGATITIAATLADPRVVTTADDATAVIDVGVTDQYQLTAIANATTFTTTGTPVNGRSITIRLKDAGVAKALTWDAVFRTIGVTLPTTTVANKTHYIGCKYNSADTKWDVLAVWVEA